ncbi:MAG: 4-hydroxy-tetrahydrodipicolinate reductase, partial [Christensenellaceae bacterium]|nr:4-hydroxy-tetrahydrodipicolinate reductase [Christensenellaceae bacterium]
FELVKQVADFYGDAVDIEIIEKHHNLKVDAPSGTAVTLAEIINSSYDNRLEYKYGRSPQDGRREKKELGIHSIRGGTIVGEHDVLFITPSEVLTVSHQAQTKQVFADGAITAAKYIVERQPGLYSMKDIVYQSRSVTNLSRVSDEAVITVHDLPNDLRTTAKIFKLIAEKSINVDIIAQAISTGSRKEVSFSVAGKDLEKALDALSVIEDADITAMTDLTKISVEGLGMEVMYGVAAKVFSTLDEVDVDVLLVTTDETKITFCVTNDQADAAVQAVSSLFHKILK